MDHKIEISIVDDDESVRESLVDLMNSYGYHAKAFESSEAFLDSERSNRTDCLIADIQLPGMTGVELHKRAHRARKTHSDHSDHGATRRADAPPGAERRRLLLSGQAF